MSKTISNTKKKSTGNPMRRGNSWTYLIYVPNIRTGKTRQKWVGGFATEKEAKTALEKARAEIKLGIYQEPIKQTVESYLTDWFFNVHKPTLKPSTGRGYEVNIRYHIIPHIGHISLDKLNRNDVIKLYNKLASSGLKAATVKYVHHVLAKGLKDAVLSDLIPKNPCESVKLPKQTKYKATVLSCDQISRLLAAARQSCIYLELMSAVCLGLRRGEVLGLQYRDFDFIKGTVHIQRQITVIKSSKEPPFGKTEWGVSTLKTPESDRVLFLPQQLLAAVKERQRQGDLLRVGGGFVCCDENGALRNPHTLYTEYKKLLRKLNLPDIRFHDLRHSYATAMIEQKIPLKTVSHMLGHSNISTTADIYCDVINSHQEGARVAEKVFFNV